ncbi:MAG: hypothetical protein DSM106950_09370 [Stigonema ocellatum SAG 48.90 = DSM 106950]|nr:hypothetical protein [Stigonema ocellatum SAG 48.90 = DSM 106950]
MFNKFVATISIVATVATATLSFSATSAFAGGRVHVIKNCMAYNNIGQPVSTLRVGEYYPMVKGVKFNQSGKNGVRVLVWDSKNQRNGTLNIATHCLESNQGIVIQYN